MCSSTVHLARRALSISLLIILLGGLVHFAPSAAPATLQALGAPGNENWATFSAGPDNGTVYALAVDSSDTLYAGGSFTTTAGLAVTRIAKWDGTSWSALGSSMDNGTVYALVVSGTTVYAGGDFTSVGGVTINGVAVWNGSNWSGLGNGITGTVRALAIDSAGNLYAGGNFVYADGAQVNHVAVWNGSNWSALGTCPNCGVSAATVYSLVFDGTGNLYVGGQFTSAGGVSTNRVARWDGAAWSAVGGTTGPNGSVYALTLDSASNLYACGSFSNITMGGVSTAVNRIARWDGAAWGPLGTCPNCGLVSGATCRTMAVDGADNLYAAGNIASAAGGTLTVNHIAKWNGTAWSALGAGLGSTGSQALTVRDGDLYLGANNLTTVGGVATTQRIARWTAAEGHSVSGTGDYVFYRPTALVTTTLPVTVSVTLPGNLDRINIQRFNTNHPSATSGIQTGYYWQIEGLNASGGTASGFSADLTLPANGFTPDSQDMVCRYTGGDWVCGASSYNATSITRRVVSFSDWATGNDVGRSVVTLTVASAGSGTGSVTSTPSGIDCGATCAASYDADTVVTLTVTLGSGSIFAGWSGACSGTGDCIATMDASKSVTATFALVYPLEVNRAGNGSGTITSDPAGIDCGSTCSANFETGTVVTLTAAPAANSTFAGWSGEGCSGTDVCTVTMDAAKNVTATLTLVTHTLTVNKTGNGTGLVESTPAGIDCGGTCAASFDYGTVVTLTATADADSAFNGWSGAGCTGTDVCIVTMDAAKSVTAIFRSLLQPMLTVNKAGNGDGTITSVPAGIDCGGTCMAGFDKDVVVTLTVAVSTGSTFVGWDGEGCSGTGDCVLAMTVARTVTATFQLQTFPLSVNKAGNGNGSITSTPAGIDCGATCAASYDYGTVVTLTAASATGSHFDGWSGETCSGTGDCALTIDAAKNVTATFTIITYTVTVNKPGNGSGTVSSSPAAIDCGATCTASFDYGTVVTLTAAPASDSSFFGWGGACAGKGQCVVTMTAAQDVTATFTFNYPLPFTDDFESYTLGGAAIKWTPGSGNWSVVLDGSHVYSQGASLSFGRNSVTGSPDWSDYAIQAKVKPTSGTYAMLITRYQDPGNYYLMALRLSNGKIEFKKVVGGSSVGLGSTANLGIVADTWYTATFEVVGTTLRGYLNGTLIYSTTDALATPPYLSGMAGVGTYGFGEFDDVIINMLPVTLTVTRTGSGSGAVSSVPAGIDCGSTCTAGFMRDAVVTLVATPTVGSSFAGWMGDCTGTGDCVVTMDEAKSVVAVFSSLSQPMLLVNKAGNGTGNVTSIPAGIDCGTTCAAPFAQNTVVTLTATPIGGSTFAGWSGASCSGTGVCTVTMDAVKNVTATFIYVPYPLAVTKVGNGSGTVTSLPPAISCGVTCTANVGGIITLTATADPLSSFAGWDGAGCSGTGQCVLLMNSAKNITATFRTYATYLPIVASYIATVTVAPLYVAPTGTDSNPGTIGQPFKTLDKAVSVVVPGQTIFMRGGVYSHTQTISLTKTANSVNMYRIWAYQNEKPVLDFSGQPYTSTARGFYIGGAYWHLKGLEIKNAGDNGIYIDGSHNIIEQCILHDNRDSGLQIGLGSTSVNPNGTLAAYNQVINCDSYRNFDPPDGSDADGFAAKLHAGKGNVFKGCRSWENADDGWDLFDADYPVVIENSWTWHNGDRTLFGNPSVWGGNGNGFKIGGNGNHAANIVTNCIAFDHVYGPGGDVKGFDLNGNRSGNTVYNSLAFSNTINYSFPLEPDDGTHHALKNNVAFAAVTSNANLSADTIQISNTWNLTTTVTANLADYVSLDVNQAKATRQVDGSLPTGFARLVAGSDLIDKGVDVGLPFCGSAPDLGPFEYCPY